jgi:hypothetical protein
MIEFAQSDYDRFAAKVILPEDVEDVETCWIWNGAKHGEGRGYGKFHLMGKTMSAHRAAFLLFKGMLRKDWSWATNAITRRAFHPTTWCAKSKRPT